jgi:hypothetical protein
MKPVDNPNPEPEGTGLPWPRSWRGVYLLVVGTFILWVALLWLLLRTFA